MMTGSTVKPIKRNQGLVELSRDHHFALLLVSRIRQDLKSANDCSAILSYVKEFCHKDLLMHFREEEELIFPLLPPDNQFRLRAEKEHAELYELIAHFDAGHFESNIFADFANKLYNHVRFEERILFAEIEKTADQNVLQSVCNQIIRKQRKAEHKKNKLP